MISEFTIRILMLIVAGAAMLLCLVSALRAMGPGPWNTARRLGNAFLFGIALAAAVMHSIGLLLEVLP